MKTMLLNELISLNDEGTNDINIECIVPYKKSLLTYYKDQFCCDPILMVTSVFNACSYAIIVPANEFIESVVNYIGDPDCINEDSENFAEYETICFNSIMLENL